MKERSESMSRHHNAEEKHHHDSHSHSHSHAPKNGNFGTAFFIVAVLNVAFVIIEIGFGIFANSTALVADATHNAGDVLGIILSWVAYRLAMRTPTKKFTFGLRSASVLAALANVALIFFATGGIVLEAIQRLNHPAPVAGLIVMLVAGAGIIINSISAYLLVHGQSDLNIKSAFQHLLTDTVVSVGVLIAGFLILMTGITWLDPLASIIISVTIVLSTWGIAREALHLLMQAVPVGIDVAGVETYLKQLDGVISIHDLHVWPIGTSGTALTAHLVISRPSPQTLVLKITEEIKKRFEIGHSTFQIETVMEAKDCELVPEEVI